MATEKGGTIRTNYDLRNQNGGAVWLPPNPSAGLNNIARPTPYSADSVQKYPVGTIGFLGEKKFAYCYAGAAILGNSRLLVDSNHIPSASGLTDTDGFEGYVYEAAAAGATTVVIEDGTDRVKDYYQDGEFTIFNADGVRSCVIRIAASDVATSVNNVTLYLDEGLPWAIVEHDWCDAYRSPYSNVTQPASTHFEAFIGRAHCAVTSGYWFWAQIAGRTWLAQYGDSSNPGYTADYRDVFAWFDGTVKVGATAGALQRVGYALGTSIATTGDTYCMMQLG
jgi:hypothetical protein